MAEPSSTERYDFGALREPWTSGTTIAQVLAPHNANSMLTDVTPPASVMPASS